MWALAHPSLQHGSPTHRLSFPSGAAATWEAAGLVLPSNDAACLLRAMVWGRATLQRVRAFLVFQLTCNLVTMAVSSLASLTTGRLPLNVMQLLFINIVTDSLGAVGAVDAFCATCSCLQPLFLSLQQRFDRSTDWEYHSTCNGGTHGGPSPGATAAAGDPQHVAPRDRPGAHTHGTV